MTDGEKQHTRQLRKTTKLQAVRQRRAEILAAYAQSPPGEPMRDFLKRVSVEYGTWHGWIRTDDDFRETVEAIRLGRQRIDLGSFEQHLKAVGGSLLNNAIAGDTTSIRLILEQTGHLKPGGITNNVKVTNTQAEINVSDADAIASLIAERTRLAKILERSVDATDESDGLPDIK